MIKAVIFDIDNTVAVCDPTVTTDISGIYTVQTGSYRYWFSSGATVPFADLTVTIRKAASGIFYISDLMGGYYDQRAGYGSKYAMNGYIQLTNENELFVLSGYVPGWGDSYDDFYDGSYDPDAQTLTVAAEKTWHTRNGLVVNGTLNVNGNAKNGTKDAVREPKPKTTMV